MKRAFYYILLIVYVFLASSPLYGLAAITGTVTDSTTGLPISGALVEAVRGSQVRFSDTTDVNGDYLLSNVQPSNYTLVASAAGYQTQFVGVRPPNNQTTVVNFALVPDGGEIAGTVINATTLLPIAGATVHIFQGSTLIEETTTNGSGVYSVPNLAPGNYIVEARATSFQLQFKGASVQVGVVTTVNFALESSPGTISGTVTDSSTTDPIEGALVGVFEGTILVGFSDTDSSGDYTIPSLAPGSYSVVATATAHQLEVEGANVVASTTTTVDFALDPNPGAIAGKVTNALTEAGIPSATVLVFQNFTLVASLLTDTNGDYFIPDLAPDNYIVIANAPNFEISAVGARVTSNNTTTVNFALDPNPGIISGTVTDATTTDPIAGATIEVFDSTVLIAVAITDSNGNYQVTSLAPGDYFVVAGKDTFQTQVAAAIVLSNETTTVNFALVSNPGTISGTVTDASTTDPIPNATIAVFQGTTFIHFELTDSSGDYTISNLAPGSYTVVAIAEGFQANFSNEIVSANSVTTADFALNSSPGAISGTITEACAGNAVGGAVVLVSDGSVIVGFDVSDNNGAYTVSNLAPDNYIVAVVKQNFLISSSEAVVIANTTTILNFALIPIPLPPTSISQSGICNKYLTRTDCVPLISWTASPSQCVTGYLVFRDETQIGLVSSLNELQFIDCNFNQEVAVYSVRTINTFRQESAPLSIP